MIFDIWLLRELRRKIIGYACAKEIKYTACKSWIVYSKTKAIIYTWICVRWWQIEMDSSSGSV